MSVSAVLENRGGTRAIQYSLAESVLAKWPKLW
jgi:hypothetical protein